MPVNHISDYIVINQGGTPGTAGTGAYFVASLADVFDPALSSAASANPTTLTAFEGSIIWHAGAPFIWNGTAYEAVRAAAGAATPDARFQVGAVAPTTRADGSALAGGDLWSNTANDTLLVYDGTAYVSVGGGAAGGNSTFVDNGNNTVTHTGGGGGTFTLTKAPAHVAGPAAPATPYVGDTWFDTVNSKLFKRVNDGTTNVWQDITGGATPLDPRLQSNAAAPTTRADTTPLQDGDFWYDTTNDAQMVWESGAWVGVSKYQLLHGQVGSVSFAIRQVTGFGSQTVLYGNTVAGSGVRPSAIEYDASSTRMHIFGTTLTGTWRVLGSKISGNSGASNTESASVVVRIA